MPYNSFDWFGSAIAEVMFEPPSWIMCIIVALLNLLAASILIANLGKHRHHRHVVDEHYRHDEIDELSSAMKNMVLNDDDDVDDDYQTYVSYSQEIFQNYLKQIRNVQARRPLWQGTTKEYSQSNVEILTLSMSNLCLA